MIVTFECDCLCLHTADADHRDARHVMRGSVQVGGSQCRANAARTTAHFTAHYACASPSLIVNDILSEEAAEEKNKYIFPNQDVTQIEQSFG